MSDHRNYIPLFRSLFKGREDVFAIRWEKGTKSGYMPAYFYDPYRYKAHVLKGGSFQTFTEKSYLLLTDEQITKHLNGKQHIGLYPLLTDNTSWFIAADFDKENCAEECRSLLKICYAKGISAYLERSRSGKGGHVWIFFERLYPANKSRKIMLSLLREAGILSAFDKATSFDRLFPNQDALSGKGLGNLIALPLHGPSVEQGNSCFIDPETLLPGDQWAFLSGVKKVGVEKLDEVLNKLFLKRNTYYRKLERQATLFDDPKEELPETRAVITIEKEIKVPIESLVFKYGSIAFPYEAAETVAILEFEIENDEIRPEFDVLKPYFEKALKSKNVSVSIHAEFENGKLVSQSAVSEDIKRINREVIEGMRFRFASKYILNSHVVERKENLLDITQVQSGHQIYVTSEELLGDLLKNNQFRHHKQLRYLAERHAGNLLKIRFVLRPFSFVFLIAGTEQYHIILETLDTEEATYLWHFDKSLSLLLSKLKEIDAHLQVIRN